MMIEKVTKNVLKFINFFVFAAASFSVNSACFLIYGQPEESEDIKFLSKHK